MLYLLLLRTRRKQPIDFGRFIKIIPKWDYDITEKHKPFSGIGVGNVAELVGRYAKLFRENLSVALRLVEHINEVTVFKFVLSRVRVHF